MSTAPTHRCPDGTRCVQVDVNGAAVAVSFHGDLTPVEALAAFLRDVADYCSLDDDLLRDLADQFDPPRRTPAVVTLTPKGGLL